MPKKEITITDLAGMVQRGFSEISSQMENMKNGLENRMDGLENRMSGLDNRMSGLDKKIDGVNSRLINQETRLDNLCLEVRDLRKQLDKIDNIVYSSDLEKLRMKLEKKMAALEQKFNLKFQEKRILTRT